jgi:pimeloyl-ACP methyl ester carboxylesterase
MRIPKPVTGLFPNTMAYARWGDGPKTLLVVPGGPGNEAPAAGAVRMMGGSLRPLVEDGYTLWMVTRRRGMPQGHTIEDMADDYANLVAAEFDGQVDVVVGISMGGLIGLYLAADHPDRFDHIALVGAAYTVSPQGRRLDYDWAHARSRGEWTKAGRLMAGAMLSDSRLRWTAPALGTLMGLISRSHLHDRFAADVMVEADAEVTFDARPVLPRIQVPVLLVNGDKDLYFPTPLIAETTRLIPNCTPRTYQGKGHLGVCTSRQLAPDILDFIEEKQTITT